MAGQKVTEVCYIQTCACSCVWWKKKNGGKKKLQKVFKPINLFISTLSLLQLGLGSIPAVSKSLTPLRSLLLFLPRQQQVYSAKRSCCNVEEGERGKTAMGKSAAYEQSPPLAVFSLSLKMASCKERTTGMGSCHSYCLATVILTEDRKQYIRSKLKTNSYTICYGGSSHME